MKKLISAIPIAILISILLFDTEKAFAYTWNYYVDAILTGPYKCAIYVHRSGDSIYYFYTSDSNTSCSINGNVLGGFDSVRYMYWYPFVHREDGSWYLGNYHSPTNVEGCDVVVMKGSVSVSNSNINYYSSIDNFVNPPTPTPTPTPTPVPSWSKTMWDTLQEELGNPAFWFGEWFIDIIDQVFGNEEEPSQGPSRISDSTHIKQVTPAPTPTPIPYSTITVPKTDIITGTTVYETNYYYTDSNGNNVVATSPPTNTPAQDNSGGGYGDNYNPVDPYAIPEVSWFTDAEIGDTSYDGIDSIMQGFDSIDTIGNDYTDGMSAVEDATGTLPTSWLLLIGIAAAIPLIAGIISRFLS